MQTRRVLILCQPGLLGQGLRSLLESDPRLEIISAVGDAKQAADMIRELKPYALIVDEDRFPINLGHAPSSIPLDSVSILVMVRERENSFRQYRIQDRVLEVPQDLIEALLA